MEISLVEVFQAIQIGFIKFESLSFTILLIQYRYNTQGLLCSIENNFNFAIFVYCNVYRESKHLFPGDFTLGSKVSSFILKSILGKNTKNAGLDQMNTTLRRKNIRTIYREIAHKALKEARQNYTRQLASKCDYNIFIKALKLVIHK